MPPFFDTQITKKFMQAWNNIDPQKRQSVIDRYMAELEKRGKSLPDRKNESNEEVAAAYAEELFNFPDVWDFVLDGEPTLKDRVIAFFKGSLKRYSFAPEMDPAARAWLREYKKLFDQVAQLNAGNNVATNVGADKRVIRRLGKMVDENSEFGIRNSELDNSPKTIKKLGKIVENAQKTPLTNINQEDMNVSGRGAINEEFEERLDRWDKKTIGFSFVVGETSTALQEAGIPKRQIRWDASKIATLLKKHQGMSIEVIKQIPQLLESPVIVIDSKKGPNAKIVMGDLYDSNNKIVTAVLLLTPTSKKGNVLELIKISSAEGRGHIKSLFTYDDGSPVLIRYIDKKRIQSWLNVNRLQLPLHNLDSDSNNSIHHPDKKNNSSGKNSSKNVDSGERFALMDGNRATTTEVVAAKRAISNAGVDPRGIISIADKYFGRYDGELSRTGIRYEFLHAAELLLDPSEGSLDRAYTRIEALADELTNNEKDTSGMTEDLNQVKRHIREITFEVRDRDKGEFDSVGGYAAFRKSNFGKLKLANDGANVDSVYGELQNLYGTSIFPDYNTVGEMLVHISEVLEMEPMVQTESKANLEAMRNETAVAITGELAGAYDVKLSTKSEKLSKADAEAYKARMNARAETKAAKAIAAAKRRLKKLEDKIRERAEKQIARAEEKANHTLEVERTKLKAEYETDRVFTQSSVTKGLGEIDAFKDLPAKERSDISHRVWRDFNESDGYNSREWIALKWTTELTDRLVREKGDAVAKRAISNAGVDPRGIIVISLYKKRKSVSQQVTHT